MKVALLSSLYAPYNVGGTEKAVLLLAEALAAHGTDVFVISLHPGREQVLESCNGIRVYRLPIDNLYLPWLGGQRPGTLRRLLWHLADMWNRKAARRVRSILQDEQPNILHTHSLSGFSVAVGAEAQRLGIAHIHTLHDYYLLCTKTTMVRSGRVCTTQCIGCAAQTLTRRHASSQVNAVVGVSDFILQRHLDAGYFAAVPSHIVTNIQPALPQTSRTPDATLTFGYIGRVTQPKGIETLLEAFAAMPATNIALKIAGNVDADYLATLQQRFPDPRIQWLGFVPPTDFFASVDVVVIPSLWQEPLGYTCLEALFAGKSVIASNIGGLSVVVSLVPQHRLVRPGDVAALRLAMQAAVDNPDVWKHPPPPSPQVLARFSATQITAQYQRIYSSSLDAMASSNRTSA